MKIHLDHVQRLNLHALLGAQRGDLATIRAIWVVQDKLALTAEEEKAIELKREVVAGQERVTWNPASALPPRAFDLTDPEAARIRSSLETWVSYSPCTDRGWLEPLLDAITPEPQR